MRNLILTLVLLITFTGFSQVTISNVGFDNSGSELISREEVNNKVKWVTDDNKLYANYLSINTDSVEKSSYLTIVEYAKYENEEVFVTFNKRNVGFKLTFYKEQKVVKMLNLATGEYSLMYGEGLIF